VTKVFLILGENDEGFFHTYPPGSAFPGSTSTIFPAAEDDRTSSLPNWAAHFLFEYEDELREMLRAGPLESGTRVLLPPARI
jgi:hypothetical protein